MDLANNGEMPTDDVSEAPETAKTDDTEKTAKAKDAAPESEARDKADSSVENGEEAKPAAPDSKTVIKPKYKIAQDPTRDDLLTEFGKETLKDRYLLPGESFQDLFARVASAYADDQDHAQRIYDYVSQLWFMPATPVLSNGGTGRGLPISCYLNSVDDSLEGIVGTWNENVWLASRGGGIGTYWGNVRGIGEPVGLNGKTSGIIPFVRVMDSLTLAISQGSLRRGSAAVYIDISHPEIEEFLEIRKPSGDFNRKALNLHHGVLVTDEFMEAVREGAEFELRSPKDGSVRGLVDARALFQKLVETRLATGEPYIVFNDTVNNDAQASARWASRFRPRICVRRSPCRPASTTWRRPHRRVLSELAQPREMGRLERRQAFIEDVMRFLDNVLPTISTAPRRNGARQIQRQRERSVGLGVMGFHSLLQQRGLGFESALAKSLNMKIFKHIQTKASEASMMLANERGPCPDAADQGVMERFSCKMAIAPTASISIICGGTSACIEPIPANIYTHKTLSGSFIVKNKYLEKLLVEKAKDATKVWNSILEKGGSVQHLDFLTQEEKDSFKTSFEIDQRWLLELAADRAPYIDQAQSLNLFIPADVDKWDLLMLHFRAWELGIKSLYYLRSKSVARAGFAGGVEADNTLDPKQVELATAETTDYDECLACQ